MTVESTELHGSAEAGRDQLRKLIVRRINDSSFRLPPLPGVAERLMQASGSASSADLAKIVMNDQALTSNVVRFANSAYYGGVHRCDTLASAITRIGALQVQMLAMGYSLLQRQGKKDPFGDERQQLAEHSIGTAYLCGMLAEASGFTHAESAFLGGLLHDVGQLIIYLVLSGDQTPAAAPKWSKADLAAVVADYHTVTGAVAVKAWNLYPWLSEVTRFHHEFQSAAEEKRLVALVALGNRLAHRYGIGCEPVELELMADGIGEAAACTVQHLERVASRLDQVRDLVRQISAAR